MISFEVSKMAMLEAASIEFVDNLATGLQSRPYKAGEVIVSLKKPGTSLILIVSGYVDVVVDGEKVAQLSNGEYFGETNLLGLESQWRASLIGQSRCDICEIK